MLTARCGSCRQLGLIDVPYRNEMEKSHPHRACGVGLGAGSWDSATQTRDSVATPRDRLAKSGSLYTQTHGTLLRLRFDSEMRVTAPAREGRKEGAKHIKTECQSADLLMVNYCEQVVHSRYISWDSSPWPANGRRAHRPAGTVVGPVTRGRDI